MVVEHTQPYTPHTQNAHERELSGNQHQTPKEGGEQSQPFKKTGKGGGPSLLIPEQTLQIWERVRKKGGWKAAAGGVKNGL